jgi:hypothetical protein
MEALKQEKAASYMELEEKVGLRFMFFLFRVTDVDS